MTTHQEKGEKAVAIVSRSSMTRGQASLYDLIVSKIDSGDKITIEEAEAIWRSKVCRKMYDGIPYRSQYGYWKDGEWCGSVRDIPMTAEDVRFSVLDWLIRNVGLLVIRGYLKVIPGIQLEPSRSEAN